VRVRSLPNIITVLLGLLAFAAPASAQTSDPGGAQPTSPDTSTSVSASGGREYGTDDPTLQPVVAGPVAKLLPDGLAAAPLDAPQEVQQAIWAANGIIGLPYVYGGGHGNFKSRGYDCSGTVSYALHGANLLRAPLDSSSFMHWGLAGKGTWFTVYTNPGHAFAVIAGLRLDTSPAGDRTGLRGPRWRPVLRSAHGFRARHPLGF
jgi:cell wall-associated NlpC family hydrolase